MKLLDRSGVEIKVGDFVSLDGNMTADDSMGSLPNGWTFDEDDIYEVYFDDRIGKLSLKLGVEPDSAYNAKYMSHAVSLLYSGDVKIVKQPDPLITTGVPNKLALVPKSADQIDRIDVGSKAPARNEEVRFSRHVEDGTLRLYKADSILDDTPAGYSEENVSVKIMVRTPSQEFVVTIKTTRRDLDKPGVEDYLAQVARNWQR